jgi:NAD-reducing hydrogenase small subunit
VPTLRNSFSVAAILEKGHGGGVPNGHLGSADSLPRLLPHVRPVHEVVSVDVFVPGCPPSADVIYGVLSDLLAGRVPSIASATRFGA